MPNNFQEQRSFTPKRSLGQNFLIAPKIAEHIAKIAANSTRNTSNGPIANCYLPITSVLEVGPGKGMLTKELLRHFEKVIAIEKDDNLALLLEQTFKKEIKTGHLELVHGDALDYFKEDGGRRTEDATRDVTRTSASILRTSRPYVVAANIPYNITGELLRMFLTTKHKPKSITVLVQKEVAERIAKNKGKESLLSLSVKVYGQPSIEGKVPRTLFRPVPNVDSAVLHIANVSNSFFEALTSRRCHPRENGDPENDHATLDSRLRGNDTNADGNKDSNENDSRNCDRTADVEKRFFELLKLSFGQKRKFLSNNLSSKYTKEQIANAFAGAEIAEKARAEELTIKQWGELLLQLEEKGER